MLKCPHCGSYRVCVQDDSPGTRIKLCLSCDNNYIEFKDKEGEVNPDLFVGEGTKIWQPTNLYGKVIVGKNCSIGVFCDIGGTYRGVIIGDNVKIQSHSFIPDSVVLADNVFIGPGVTFTNDKHPPSGKANWLITFVDKGASIGARATILPGITIGANAKIGAGSVVTKNVPANTTVCGNPAKPHNKHS